MIYPFTQKADIYLSQTEIVVVDLLKRLSALEIRLMDSETKAILEKACSLSINEESENEKLEEAKFVVKYGAFAAFAGIGVAVCINPISAVFCIAVAVTAAITPGLGGGFSLKNVFFANT
ncbi:hypothetical protein Mgra_00007880 [Meloidogyne graminicola]|uniref:Uncharacterized protein n=1 Tax=Meloidogyne graminicola TaxID=189291 RepID=A0A8S9ZHG7_9BILA|nr:hypothetical protein Mgra_00007880 [Meloidogyne graminicola]